MSVSFNFVTERIAVGGAIGDINGLNELIAQGITHIIDMQAEFDDQTLRDSRVTVLWLPQEDDGTPRPPGHYLQGARFAYAMLAIPEHKIYCHCAAGVNRGPTMCYALLRSFGIPKEEAIGMIQKARPQVGFFHQQNYLDSVEKDLR
jgi:protein-tyrosine phosphatase